MRRPPIPHPASLENVRPGDLQPPTRLGRAFGDLRVRPKLILLHNLFFLLLAGAVYFTLIPLFEERVQAARGREILLVMQLFSDERRVPAIAGLELYQFNEGTAEKLGIPADVRAWLDTHPGRTWGNPVSEESLYRKLSEPDLYRTLRIPHAFYNQAVKQARTTLFIVLGVIYLLAVVFLEIVIMPGYVYFPLRLMLEADKATQRNDRAAEVIDERYILEDEIGRIMRSRNETITKLRQHEDELEEKNRLLEEAKASLEQQDRLVSLGMLSASIVHELNTPLAVLHGSIEKLKETVQMPQAQERLNRMLRVTERLRKISEGLLDFSRARKLQFEQVGMRALIDEAWSLVAIDEKASVVSFENLVMPDAVVMGSADRLMQVFVNLIRNALHAVQGDGRIVVRSKRTQDRHGDWLTIAVEDNGPGIPADVLPDIFDAFVSSRLDSKGTGLGLTVAEGIVDQHGGAIHAENCKEGGARLEVRLPAVKAVQ